MSRSAGSRLGLAAAAFAALAGALLLFIYLASERRLRTRYSVPVSTIRVPDDAASIERGRHLFTSVGTCALCHAADGGGTIYARSALLGVIAGPNLTRGRGGIAPAMKDTDWDRAIRRGVASDGRSLIVMPSEVFVNLSDDDAGALIAYIKQLPPVDREIPPTRFYLAGRAMLAFGRLDILTAPKTTDRRRVAAGEQGTIDHGKYLANISGCHGCHGYGLSGGRVAGPPDLPPASNLTRAGLGSWSETDFVRVMREGKRPDGTALHDFMPWRQFRGMSDVELHALWGYLRSVPAKPFGNK